MRTPRALVGVLLALALVTSGCLSFVDFESALARFVLETRGWAVGISTALLYMSGGSVWMQWIRML